MVHTSTYDPGPLGRQVFHEAKLWTAYEWMGAHKAVKDGDKGVRFVLWAPHAKAVSLVGDFNDWQTASTPMLRLKEDPTLWTVFVAGLEDGAYYQYAIMDSKGQWTFKADPYGFEAALRPNTASRVHLDRKYRWYDKKWMENRPHKNHRHEAMNIYEVHAGSWRYKRDGTLMSYRDLADNLIPYVKKMGYTHIEFMPIMEHPLDASWGYQITGYFAPTSRYGRPNDLRYFIDMCHRNGIGVFLDWVPAHFCKDQHGLRLFDGKPLYEYENPKRAENHGWGTLQFDLKKPEVVSFLLSNAIYWLREFHFDGLRVDAVASMLYLDYDRDEGQWDPNQYGGRENIESIDFLRYLNRVVHEESPGTLIIAEESTSWPMVTKPDYDNGLGFDYKWNMGWMNDTLEYAGMDSLFRKHHQDKLTFSITYAFSENFVLPLSHDEVVHGKKSFLDKMPGDYWQQFANLRAFYGYWMTHPGKKLLFMGGEFGQYTEWSEARQLDWSVLSYDNHRYMQDYMRALNSLYKKKAPLWEQDCEFEGFKWMDCNDKDKSIVSYVRFDKESNFLVMVCNFTPGVHHDYKVPVPRSGSYKEIFNSDDPKYGGSGQVNGGTLKTVDETWLGEGQHLNLTIPPLAIAIYEWKAPRPKKSTSPDPSAKKKRSIRKGTARRSKEANYEEK